MAAEGPGPTAPRSPQRVAAPVTRAQKLAALLGVLLLAAGAFGFIGDGSFDTGDGVAGGSFLGFEVNGWLNVLHGVSGLVLLIASGSRAATRGAWRLLSLVYLVVFVTGLIDGNDAFRVFPVNGADHWLHGALFVIAFLGARSAKETRQTLERDRVLLPALDGPSVVGPGSGHVGGPRRPVARIDARL
jgi:hypothetical protein